MESSAWQHVELSDALKICDGIMSNFYTGLSHMLRTCQHSIYTSLDQLKPENNFLIIIIK